MPDDLRQRVGQRLVRARKEAGLSQERAAQIIGIDRPRLSGMENGERPIELEILASAARVYGVTMSYLIGGAESPRRPVELRLRTAVANAVSEGEANALLSNFLKFAERYSKLLALADEPHPDPDLLPAASGSTTRQYAVEGDAERLRDLWGLDDAPVGLRIFELLGDHGIGVYREALATTEICGAYLRQPGLPALIFVNARDWPYRQVFTTAHELAHLIYHGNSGVSLRSDESADEDLANSFASAFLMPESAVKRNLAIRGTRSESIQAEDVIDLHRYFGVSYAAMLVRLQRLGIVRAPLIDELGTVRPILTARQLGYALATWELSYQPDQVAAADRLEWLPHRYVRLVRQAWQQHTITDRQAANYLNLDYEAWASLFNGTPPEDEQAEQDLENAKRTIR